MSKIVMSKVAEETFKANSIAEGTPLMAELAVKLEASLVAASATISRRDIDSKFGDKMDTIRIAVPQASIPAEHSDGGNSATDFIQTYRNVTLDKLYTVDHEFTAEQWTNLIKTGGSEVLDSMVHGMSEQLESYVLQTYAEASGTYDQVPGTNMDAYADIISTRAAMNKLKVPMHSRNLVVNDGTAAVMLGLDQWKDISVSGDTPALRDASLGRRAGMDIWESQFLWSTTAAGTEEAVNETFTCTIDYASNSVMADGTPYSSCACVGSGSTSGYDVSKGAHGYYTDDLGKVHKFVVLEAATFASSDGTIKIAPALTSATADATETALVFAAKQKTTNTRNLLIQKDCVCLAARPLSPYPDRFSITTTSTTGIPLRFSMGSTMNTKKIWVSLDCLVKAIVLRPEGVCTMYGA